MPLIKSNVHTHTDFCDGSNSMQDMAEYAVNIGLETLGFSFHSFTEFDKSYCIRDYYGYIKEYYRVKNLFKDRLTVLNGVELDLYGERPSVCDFVIGSAHYIKKGTRHMAVDCSEDLFRDIAARGYSGDFMAMAKDYYSQYAMLPSVVNPDIYGHFDLITKYNSGGKYFDENSAQYLSYATSAIDALPDRAVVEVNLGRLFKGTGDIYPSEKLICMMREKGCRFMLSSDAHCRQALGYKFDETLTRLKKLGIKSVAAYVGATLAEIEI
ncbi:MAG: histidinol-phosphatase HisJ family protein [Clostridia bacterium]|nr:histidinol-phosphatase HisJ family protein [Clostridia bacterium]